MSVCAVPTVLSFAVLASACVHECCSGSACGHMHVRAVCVWIHACACGVRVDTYMCVRCVCGHMHAPVDVQVKLAQQLNEEAQVHTPHGVECRLIRCCEWVWVSID